MTRESAQQPGSTGGLERNDVAHGVRRLCASVIALAPGYDGRRQPGDVLATVDAGGLPPAVGHVWWQPTAEGGVAGVWPPGIDEPSALACFLRRLTQRLADRHHSNRLRLCVAVTEGITQMGRAGFTGPALLAARRASSGPWLTGQLSRRQDADIVVAVTYELHRDLAAVRADNAQALAGASFSDGPLLWCELLAENLPNPALARSSQPGIRVQTTALKDGSSTMRVAFLGKCGAGKTSLINSLFHLDLDTGRFEATTLDLQYVDVHLPTGHGEAAPIEIVDTPGFAESQDTEEAYRRIYSALLPTVDHLVWVVAAHPRAFRPDQEALKALAHTIGPRTGVTVVITRADTIGPGGWDSTAHRPSEGQCVALREQVGNVLGKLAPYLPRLTEDDIVPCSTTQHYALDSVTEHIRLGLLAAKATEQ
ncbi:GTPase [Streptomyces sp. NPDC002187]|uniref:GTPase n=1 Tax=Streptomyces sp. NPDC002187 TaxID=3364637 RepID=UPI0036BC3B53